MSQDIEVVVSDARNGDNLLEVVRALRRLLHHSMSPRQFRELAEPLMAQVLDELEPALMSVKSEDRRKGMLTSLVSKPEQAARAAKAPKAKTSEG